MKLTILVDNNTLIDKYYLGEAGVCYYIEEEQNKILFDTGYSDIFIKNAQDMNINLKNINSIIISHGHDDHTRGLKYFRQMNKNNNVKVYAHPCAFNEKNDNNLLICSPYSIDEMKNYFNLNISNKPINITNNIIFLGEIPELVKFENRDVIGKVKVNNKYVDDYNLDDSALVYKSSKGLVIITGCSHSGICNIIEYSKKVCNDNNIYAIIGGFHLIDDIDLIDKTIKYFKDNDIKLIYPCHCTSLLAKVRMINNFGDKVKEVGVGLKIEF